MAVTATVSSSSQSFECLFLIKLPVFLPKRLISWPDFAVFPVVRPNAQQEADLIE